VLAPNPGGAAVTLEGMTAGGDTGGDLFGAGCGGFVTDVPDAILRLESAAETGLMIYSDDRTALVLDGPGGPVCHLDAAGAEPAISERLEPGLYRLYVGAESPGAAQAFYLTVMSQ